MVTARVSAIFRAAGVTYRTGFFDRARTCLRMSNTPCLIYETGTSIVGERPFSPELTMENGTAIQTKLLMSTERLIYAGGINATGMDAIVRESGVARKNIYRLYPTKELLVAAALGNRDQRWMQWLVEGTSNGDPAHRLRAIFPLLRSWFDSTDFRGCAFINAAGEIGDPQSAIRAVTALHKRRLLKYLEDLIRACGIAEYKEVAWQFLVLIDGATAVAMVTGQAGAADCAGRAAELLLRASSPEKEQ